MIPTSNNSSLSFEEFIQKYSDECKGLTNVEIEEAFKFYQFSQNKNK